jgi:iron complex transport system permease protein
MGKPNKQYPVLFLFLLLGIVLCSLKLGAVYLSIDEIVSSLSNYFRGSEDLTLNERIFLQIRLPRTILGVFVGATLAVGGVLMQALFRNPLVEPGLVGTSSGAAFGAAFYFVMGAVFNFSTGMWSLPLAACLGGILSTALVFLLARSKETGKSSIVGLLLTGIAVNALFMSGVGFLSYIARDPQARSIVFWNLGTLSGANWQAVILIGATTILGIAIALAFAKQLNALMLGEEEAQYLGVDVRKLKWIVLLINVCMVAVATAFVGVISFIGLIVPHLLRMMNGSENRNLILNGALLGSILLCFSDFAARMLLRPAELPIGIVTSMIGVPVFIHLLRRKNYYF